MFFTQKSDITYFTYILVNRVFWNTLPVLSSRSIQPSRMTL